MLCKLCNPEERAERSASDLFDDFNRREEMDGESAGPSTTLRGSDPQSRKRRFKEELAKKWFNDDLGRKAACPEG